MKKILILLFVVLVMNSLSYSQQKVDGTSPKFSELPELRINDQLTPDGIGYYLSGYYKKWEAEEDVPDLKTGIKHEIGERMEVDGVTCWGVSENRGKGLLITGPHYSQDKAYRLYYLSTLNLIYKVRFKIKLLNPVEPLEEICKIQPVLRYAYSVNKKTEYAELLLNSTTVLGKDLSTDEFRFITIRYTYPESLLSDYRLMYPSLMLPDGFNDKLPGTGIQFNLECTGKGRIAVDFIEISDQAIWDHFMNDPLMTAKNILMHAGDPGFKGICALNSTYGKNEPLSLDSYEPYRVVDSLLSSLPGGKSLINAYYNQHPYELRKWLKR